MKRIELKVNPKIWIALFIFFLAFASIFLTYLYPNITALFILSVAFCASVISIGTAIGIFYFYQKEVVLTEKEIKKDGFPTKSIAYEDITRIKVGSGGFSIYNQGSSSIKITTMYSNFGAAKELLNAKIKDYKEIQITGSKRYIRKYLAK